MGVTQTIKKINGSTHHFFITNDDLLIVFKKRALTRFRKMFLNIKTLDPKSMTLDTKPEKFHNRIFSHKKKSLLRDLSKKKTKWHKRTHTRPYKNYKKIPSNNRELTSQMKKTRLRTVLTKQLIFKR